MKPKIVITLVLSILLVWAGTAMAINPAKIKKVPILTHATPANQYQSDPLDSVLVIKGKINMGTTDYYSVKPSIAPQLFTIDGKNLIEAAQEMGIYKMDVFPQLKSSASAGWTIYLCAMTGSNPSYWQKFKEISNVTYTSYGMVEVKYQQSGSSDPIMVAPGAGIQISKPVGPVQPK